MIPGLDSQKCEQRNRVAARRDGVDAAPLRFFRDSPAEPSGGVRTRGYLPTTPAGILARINGLRPDGSEPLKEDQVYWHFAEAANSNFVGDRYCFLDRTTLVNIATDAEAGFAFMNSHRTGGMSEPTELPFGKTFAGQFQEWTDEKGQVQQRTIVGVYLLRGVRPNGTNGPSTDDLHAMIDGGTISDVSVGLYGGDRICDVCGNELYAYDRENGGYLCPHAPGTTRKMTPEQQSAQKARGVPDGAASYSQVDARCAEVSAVFDGAVPGAGFRKALAFDRRHSLSRTEKLEARRAFAPLLTKGDFDMADTQVFHDNGAELEQRVEGIFERVLRRFSHKNPGDQADAPPADANHAPAAPDPRLAALDAAGVTSPDQFAALAADAEAFRQARTAKREQAKATAQIAYAAHKPSLAAAIEDIEATADGPAFERLCARIEADAEKAAPKDGGRPQTRPTQNAAVHATPADADGSEAAQQARFQNLLASTPLGQTALTEIKGGK